MFISKLGTTLAVCLLVPTVWAAESPGLAKLQGKWSGKRTGNDGQEMTSTFEIKGTRLTFQLLSSDKEVRFYATGDVKTEMAGPFNVLRITGIEAGGSASEARPVDDDRSSVYSLRGDTLTLASNFDKDRGENQKPTMEAYQRMEGPAAAATTAGSASKLAGKWKMAMKLGNDSDHEYELNLAEADGKLSGAIISPRSGEHKLKTVTFSNGKLAMEWPREIEGNTMIFLFTGQAKESGLSGDVVVKGYEDQFKGTWTARK
jgi:hypothetical protein